MHVRCLLIVAASLVAAPRAAHPCSMVIQLGPTAPAEHATEIPVNAVLFITAYGLADRAIDVTAIDDSGTSVRLSATPLSPDLAQAPLLLAPNSEVELRLSLAELGLSYGLHLRTSGRRDVTPPEGVAAPVLTGTEVTLNPCVTDARQVITAEFPEARDDLGIALYVLQEMQADGPRTVSHVIWNSPTADPNGNLTLSAFTTDLDRHCYRVGAYDFAGASAFGPVRCWPAEVPDAGPPPLDAGSLDAHAPDAALSADAAPPDPSPLDAGLRLDAAVADANGRAGTLETLEPECGCRQVQPQGGAHAPWAIALGAWALLFRWTATRRNARCTAAAAQELRTRRPPTNADRR